MSDRELDEIFRKKLTQREFEFNQSNWEAMEAMLDADKKPAAFYWWSSAAIVVFGLLISTLVFVQNPLSPTEVPIVIPQENIEANEAEEPVINNVAPETDAASTEDSNGSDSDAALNTGSTVASSESGETEAISSNNVVSPSSNQESGEAVSGGEADLAIATATTTAANTVEEPSQAEPDAGELDNANVSEASSISTQSGDSQNIVEEEDLLNLDQLELSLKGLPSLTQEARTSLLTNRVRPNFIRKFQRQHEISAIAGVGVSPAFDGGNSADWVLGLNYEYRFSYLWSLNAGVTYNARTSPGISHRSDSIFHSLAPERVITEVNNSRLDYLEIPIQITHTLNPRHQIGLGIYTSALFNVKTDIERTSITIKETKKSTTTTMGLSENFQTFDYGMTASYGYQYSPALNLGLQFKYGLRDVTVNRTEELNGYHRNVSTRLILKYRLF